ncbi:MAG: ATP-binding protein [Casimicrobiaceae bacterium]
MLTPAVLGELIAQRQHFEAALRVGEVHDRLQSQVDEYFGVVRDGRYVGLISKAQIGLKLSGRFGYALYAKQAIGVHLMPEPLAVAPGEGLLAVLERALSRTGAQFHEDLPVVGVDGTLLGIMPMPVLVRLQNEIIAEQTRRAEEQRHALQNSDLQLFRSQQRLRQSEGRFGILFENSPLGFALLNPTGGIEACNGRFYEILGLPPGGELPSLEACVAPKQRHSLAALLRGFETSLEGGASRTMELRIEPVTSERRLTRCDFHWIPQTGQISLAMQDITAQRRLEQRLQQKEKSALLDSLAGGIAHELNNKLLPVLGYAELMHLRVGGNPELRQFSEIIQQSTVEASELVAQLLQLSRPPALEPRECELGTIVQEAIGILRFRLREAGCQPILQDAGSPLLLQADPAQLKQVIVNLCLNALDAMRQCPRATLRLALTVEGDCACLRIRDSGHGIPPEHLARIFDPFFTTKGVQQGTGLGLSVCFSIVQQHGGTIEVESSGPDGTVFALSLPISGHHAQLVACDDRSSRPAATPHLPGKPAVLVVDDEEFITSLVHEALRSQLGCQVMRAATAEEGLEKLATTPFDLIISDVRLPGRNGLEFYAAVLERWPLLGERFFFITGDPGSRELTIALEATRRPVLRKPFSMETLVQQAVAILQPAHRSVAAAHF